MHPAQEIKTGADSLNGDFIWMKRKFEIVPEEITDL